MTDSPLCFLIFLVEKVCRGPTEVKTFVYEVVTRISLSRRLCFPDTFTGLVGEKGGVWRLAAKVPNYKAHLIRFTLASAIRTKSLDRMRLYLLVLRVKGHVAAGFMYVDLDSVELRSSEVPLLKLTQMLRYLRVYI